MADTDTAAAPQALELRTDRFRRVWAVSPWPAKALASAAMLQGDAPFFVVSKDGVTFNMTNGRADYMIEDQSVDPLVLILQDDPPSEFTAPPEPGQEPEPEPKPAEHADRGAKSFVAAAEQRHAEIKAGEVYVGPEIRSVVLHDGVKKTVTNTKHEIGVGSMVELDGGGWHPVLECEWGTPVQ